jgi:hypothetical protein
MKKITYITLLIAVAAALFSCSKKEVVPTRNPIQSPVTSAPPKGLNYVSKWTALPFAVETERRSFWLQGAFALPDAQGYDYAAHRQFVFASVKGRNAHVFNALPMQVLTPSETINFSYTANNSGFIIKIMTDSSPAQVPSLQNSYLTSSKYRFLVITDSTYRAHNIDWTNYDEVARVLGPTIWFE